MENQLEKNKDKEMTAGFLHGFRGIIPNIVVLDSL